MKTAKTPLLTQFSPAPTNGSTRRGMGILLGSLGLVAQAATPSTPTSVNQPTMQITQISSKKTDMPSLRFAGRAPFSADEFWQKILLLLREQEGYVTKDRFEEIFDIRFAHVDRDGSSMFYSMKQQNDWYFGVALDTYGPDVKLGDRLPKSGLTIDWKYDTFGDYRKGDCVNLVRATGSLLELGWVKSGSDRKYASFDSFSKNKGKDIINLHVFGDCIKKFTVSVAYP